MPIPSSIPCATIRASPASSPRWDFRRRAERPPLSSPVHLLDGDFGRGAPASTETRPMRWMLAAAIVAALGASTVHAAKHTVGWAAWRDTQEKRLHVVGAFLAPHPGYVARL